MRYSPFIVTALAASVACASVASGQATDATPVELRPFIGVFVPIGSQSSDFKTATSVGFQGALEMSQHIHGLISGTWTRDHTKVGSFNTDVANIWQFDAGAEFNLVRPLNHGWLFRPFVGAGAGLRTYDYAAVLVGSKSCSAGYGALGTELQRDVVAFRLEGRDYVSCFQSPITGNRVTRSDIGIALGLAYHMF